MTTKNKQKTFILFFVTVLLLSSFTVLIKVPTVQAVDSTFGYLQQGGTWWRRNEAPNVIRACSFELTESNKNITQLNVYMAALDYNSLQKMSLYNSSKHLVAESVEKNEEGDGWAWHSFPITGGYNATSGIYYMALWCNSSDSSVAYDAGDVGQGFELNQTYGEWPTAISGETTRDYKASMFANYTDFAPDTTAPAFTTITSNNTYSGQPTRLSCNVTDASSVSHVMWSINNGSGYVNQSWTAFSSNPVTFDFITNSTFRTNIKAKLYANDTVGNVGVSAEWSIFSLYNFVAGEHMGFFIQNDAWDGYMTSYMLDDHLAETVTLAKNHGATDVYPFVGYYNGTWEITYINGTKALNNAANFQAIISAFNAEGIDVWAYIGDVKTPSYGIQPLNITASNYEAIQALHAGLLEIGFAGIVDDAEHSFSNYGKDIWINYSNNASAAVAALGTGKLYGACIFNDWEQNIYPNLVLGENGYIFSMFYTEASLFENVDVDAYWAENFGQYGRDTPPASKLILCYTTQYVSVQNLDYHLNNLTYQLSRNLNPNLAGFGGWNLDYMTGEDSQDWAYYDAFRTRLGLEVNSFVTQASFVSPTNSTYTSSSVGFSVDTSGSNDTGVALQIQLYDEGGAVYPENFTSATGTFTGLVNGTYTAAVYAVGDNGAADYETVVFTVAIPEEPETTPAPSTPTGGGGGGTTGSYTVTVTVHNDSKVLANVEVRLGNYYATSDSDGKAVFVGVASGFNELKVYLAGQVLYENSVTVQGDSGFMVDLSKPEQAPIDTDLVVVSGVGFEVPVWAVVGGFGFLLAVLAFSGRGNRRRSRR